MVFLSIATSSVWLFSEEYLYYRLSEKKNQKKTKTMSCRSEMEQRFDYLKMADAVSIKNGCK